MLWWVWIGECCEVQGSVWVEKLSIGVGFGKFEVVGQFCQILLISDMMLSYDDEWIVCGIVLFDFYFCLFVMVGLCVC